jgi:hypothetical protein
MEKLGIEKLKEALGIVIDIATITDKSLEDKKLSTLEKISIGIKALKLVTVIKNIKPIIAEYKDLDEAEKAEIIAYFKEKFDLRNDIIEDVIEKIFETLLSFNEIFDSIK